MAFAIIAILFLTLVTFATLIEYYEGELDLEEKEIKELQSKINELKKKDA